MRRLALVLLLAAACNQPVINPVSTEYPCGTRAHMCTSGACCWNSQECGGDTPGCPAGYCCAAGLGLDRSLTHAKPERQWVP